MFNQSILYNSFYSKSKSSNYYSSSSTRFLGMRSIIENDNNNYNYHTRSLAENYLRFNRIPSKYCNLNSRQVKLTDDQDLKSGFIEVEMKVENVSKTLKQKIYIIDNIIDVNIINWLEKFERIKEMIGWSEENIKIILQNVILDVEFITNLLDDTYAETRKRIIKYVFPKENCIFILKKLESIKQKNYIFLQDYYNEICKTGQEYA